MNRFLCVLFFVGAVLAESASAGLPVTVVSVRDGDTLTVLSDNQLITLDLEDIDAPEGTEALSGRSRQSLVELCEHRQAILDEIEIGKPRRIAAYIQCAGVDASLEQVRRGMARVVTSGLPPGSPLPEAQAEAQAAGRGLWGGDSLSSR
jgi:endonuclease YncB( thermonuclease family)